jgi:DNA invertase Pin-like site-specific DNA recombinase
MKTKPVALYVRGFRPTSKQRRTSSGNYASVAERHGWTIAEEYVDHALSGAKGRDQRPAHDKMLKAAVRKEFDILAAWSVDRLGRSLQHLVSFLDEIHSRRIDLYLHQRGIDTTTPAGKALFRCAGSSLNSSAR